MEENWMPFLSEPNFSKGQKAPFVTSSSETCQEVIKMLEIKENETLIDLGCGDGRILFKAHESTHCKCIGVDINESLISECRAKAKEKSIESFFVFKTEDIFSPDFNFYDSDCICFYLTPKVTEELKKKIINYLKEKQSRRCVLIRYPFKDIIPTKIDDKYKLYYYDYQSIEGVFRTDVNYSFNPSY